MPSPSWKAIPTWAMRSLSVRRTGSLTSRSIETDIPQSRFSLRSMLLYGNPLPGGHTACCMSALRYWFSPARGTDACKWRKEQELFRPGRRHDDEASLARGERPDEWLTMVGIGMGTGRTWPIFLTPASSVRYDSLREDYYMRRVSFLRKPAFLVPTLAALALTVYSITAALPAAACGGLVAPDGAVRLERAATLVSWHDGIEHYMTAFTYQGQVSSLGWIVPLPTDP